MNSLPIEREAILPRIDPQQLYSTIQNHLTDIETYLGYIKDFIQHPDRWNVVVE